MRGPIRYRNEVGCDDVGRRVTIRYRTADGRPTDVVGILEACDERTALVRSRRGDLVRVDRAAVVASRIVRAPAPPRRRPREEP